MSLEKFSNAQINKAIDCCLVYGNCRHCPLDVYEDCAEKLQDELKCLVLAYRTDDEKLERLRKVLENEE